MKRSALRVFGIVSVLIATLIAASALRPAHLMEINRATGALRSREIYFGTYKTPWRLKSTSFSLIAEELQLDTAHEWQSFTRRSSWLFIVERQCSSTPASCQLHYLRSELGELSLAEQRTWVRRFAAASEPERKHLIEQLTKAE